MEITQTLPRKYQIQNYTVTLNTISHTSRNTRCHLNIPPSHFVSNTTQAQTPRVLQHQKQTIFNAANKKTLFVVLLKKSFVIQKYSDREINNFL